MIRRILCWLGLHDWEFAGVIPGSSEDRDRHAWRCCDCPAQETRMPDWQTVLPDDEAW